MRHPIESWTWMGHAAHLCVSRSCLFRLATVVGPWIISTVGDYVQPGRDEEFTEIGCDRMLETYVFRAGQADPCGCIRPEDFTEIDSQGYAEASEAQQGHMDMCLKYANLELGDVPRESWA